MKLTIDYTAKTIQIIGEVDYGELITELGHITDGKYDWTIIGKDEGELLEAPYPCPFTPYPGQPYIPYVNPYYPPYDVICGTGGTTGGGCTHDWSTKVEGN